MRLRIKFQFSSFYADLFTPFTHSMRAIHVNSVGNLHVGSMYLLWLWLTR